MNDSQLFSNNSYAYNNAELDIKFAIYSYNESISKEHIVEEECYSGYDHEMTDTIEEADEQDQFYYYEEEEEEEEEEYDYQNDSLLNLILAVQTYLEEQAKMHGSKVTESPLYGLQYKMYIYMRQRAYELGIGI
ncbi:hypothetical protein G6F43_004833 [Rhizopus delemar]|nr:hypothetical protein G6F43_004833 [Rhizopus delemar]